MGDRAAGPGTSTSPGLLSFLQESECFLTREMGYFSQYVAWVREEVSGGLRPSWPQASFQRYQLFNLLCPPRAPEGALGLQD